MANRRFNTQVAQPREALAKGGKVRGERKAQPTPRDRTQQRRMGDSSKFKGLKEDKKRKSKKIEANKAEYKKMAKDISPEVSMYLKHGKDFPGFDQSRKIRGGLKKGGSALKPVQPNQKGLKKLPTKVRNKMGFMKEGGRVKKMGGGMSTARKDMMSGYYKNDMGMKGGKMYKDGGKVGKKQQGYKARKDESIAMRIRKPRTARQLKDSRDESYGKFGSKAKKSGKINR